MEKKEYIYLIDNDLDFKKWEPILNFKKSVIGIYIYGKPGVGKSTFLNHIKKYLTPKIEPYYNEKSDSICTNLIGKNTYIFNVNAWIKDIQRSWNRDKNTFDGNIKIPTNFDVLLIDDLGSEFFSESTYPYLLKLFEERYEFIKSLEPTHKTLTIVTSNYSFNELMNKYKGLIKDSISLDRLSSRIRGVTTKIFKFDGEDKRMNILREKNENKR